MTPLVSVVVATYRRNQELKNALDSLSAQTYPNFEIVVVDDNGDLRWNETVRSVVEDFQKDHPQLPLRYIVNDSNLGSARTRNAGIDAAFGEYVTFLDDDDLYLPEKIARQVAFMLDGDYDYCVTDLALYNHNDVLIDNRVRSYIENTDPASLQKYHLKYHLTGTDTIMFRKSYLLKIGKFTLIDVGDEFYLVQRAIDGKGKFGYLPGCDVKAYVHTGEGGLSSGDGKIWGENMLYEHKKQYLKQLSFRDKRYIKMRHYAVLAYAYMRGKRYVPCFVNICKAVLASPTESIRLIKENRRIPKELL